MLGGSCTHRIARSQERTPANVAQQHPTCFEIVKHRTDDRATHAGLRGEIDHSLRLVFGEYAFYRCAVFKAGFDEMEPIARHELREPGLLQGHVVVGVEVVDASDSKARVEQRVRDMEADEAGGAGEEDVSRSCGRSP